MWLFDSVKVYLQKFYVLQILRERFRLQLQVHLITYRVSGRGYKNGAVIDMIDGARISENSTAPRVHINNDGSLK